RRKRQDRPTLLGLQTARRVEIDQVPPEIDLLAREIQDCLRSRSRGHRQQQEQELRLSTSGIDQRSNLLWREHMIAPGSPLQLDELRNARELLIIKRTQKGRSRDRQHARHIPFRSAPAS